MTLVEMLACSINKWMRTILSHECLLSSQKVGDEQAEIEYITVTQVK